MHSANRAKQRLQKRTSAEAKNEAEKRLNFESAERRSKSLERKGRIKNARNQNIQKLSNSSAGELRFLGSIFASKMSSKL